MSQVRSNRTPADDVRVGILNAAERQFRALGFRKSTMAEIAEEMGMSAANLYRYFESKEELGAACCGRAMQQRIERLRAVARDPTQSAARRLELFMIENLRFSHDLVEQQPKINEMVETLTGRRPDLIRDKVSAIESLLAEVVAAGNSSGEFDVDDVVATAATLHTAMVVFEVPIFVGLYPRQHFERSASALAQLLVRGLSSR